MNGEKKGWMPKLRFPEFRKAGEWGIVPLERLASRRTVRNRDGEVVRVLTNSAEHGVVDQRDYFDKDIATQGNLENYYVVGKGDFVYNPRISAFAPVGPISRNSVAKGVMSPLYMVFRFKTSDSDFYAHYFKSSAWHLYMRRAGSTGARHDRMAISNADFMAMPLPVPSPEEQQKIADCLSSLDALITAQADKLEALKSHKKGLMQQLFPREDETVPRLRFPEFRDAGEWKEKVLGEVCHMQAGKFVRASDIKDEIEDGLYPCYGGNGLRGYTTTFTHTGEYSLIGRQGALCGNVTLVADQFHATEHAVVVTPDEEVSTVWLYYVLNYLNLNRFATGQAQPGLSVDNLNNVELRFAPEEGEQQKIADCLSSLDALITAQADKLEALKSHKKGLMQQLFPSPEVPGI